MKTLKNTDSSTDNSYLKDHVIIDTGSGYNITNRKDWLLEYGSIHNPPELLEVGDGDSPLKIVGFRLLPVRLNKNTIVGTGTFYCPNEDTTIISANKLWRDTGLSLNTGYDKLVGKDCALNTLKIEDTIWIPSRELIYASHENKLRAVRLLNIKINKPDISLLEAHLRLNHLPSQVIQKSVKNNFFYDVNEIKDHKSTKNLWCQTCSAGKMTRHFHYTDTMNHYSSIKEPGSSWSLDTFGPVKPTPKNDDKYMLVMIDNV
ncbi:Tkp4 protein [Vanderwaltozyma polyspora DSM 70294]|uniref:Tkp4 protein n=1 Tax=Vanderwaltozyma polyspora (strain ATCC 22028 / DSM 70294 / BCRC 21397 / CBS 2163 / NBRC 10782 / NRRL Y-8283 / UCD 57-17) TaxID=436907 RepID=A7TKG7_VANPO|nr:Tkp4 protein [Vanderwaltozyma polyspora DSM 70294]EDO17189.1 Tkp4 protein [Vanderwaltozyma polyspora DSM 70294]